MLPRLTAQTIIILALLLSAHSHKANDYKPEPTASPDAEVSASLRSAAPQASKVAFASLHPHLGVAAAQAVTHTTRAAAVAAAGMAACPSVDPNGHCPSFEADNAADYDAKANVQAHQHRHHHASAAHMASLEDNDPSDPFSPSHRNAQGFKVGHVDQDHQDADHITPTQSSADTNNRASSATPLPDQLQSEEYIRNIIRGPEKYHKAPEYIQKRHEAEAKQSPPPLQEPPKTDEKSGKPLFRILPIIEKLKRAIQDAPPGGSWEDDWLEMAVDVEESASVPVDEQEDKREEEEKTPLVEERP